MRLGAGGLRRRNTDWPVDWLRILVNRPQVSDSAGTALRRSTDRELDQMTARGLGFERGESSRR